ncbi:hypothetical protein FA15DRAFT_86248 [Coprinopsis marcescibilis]|uniref:Uncharacterized protein n=1 Tax=Coprinopsis marcescibilis TaxID=230819 RepID=A0A5C3L5P6_COPMA|nr:hypothetical protein FA15DRAFT_86248 [Coprinopsis marcescibilis]
MSVFSDVAALTQGVEVDNEVATIAQADDTVQIPTDTNSLATDLKTTLLNAMNDAQNISDSLWDYATDEVVSQPGEADTSALASNADNDDESTNVVVNGDDSEAFLILGQGSDASVIKDGQVSQLAETYTPSADASDETSTAAVIVVTKMTEAVSEQVESKLPTGTEKSESVSNLDSLTAKDGEDTPVSDSQPATSTGAFAETPIIAMPHAPAQDATTKAELDTIVLEQTELVASAQETLPVVTGIAIEVDAAGLSEIPVSDSEDAFSSNQAQVEPKEVKLDALVKPVEGGALEFVSTESQPEEVAEIHAAEAVVPKVEEDKVEETIGLPDAVAEAAVEEVIASVDNDIEGDEEVKEPENSSVDEEIAAELAVKEDNTLAEVIAEEVSNAKVEEVQAELPAEAAGPTQIPAESEIVEEAEVVVATKEVEKAPEHVVAADESTHAQVVNETAVDGVSVSAKESETCCEAEKETELANAPAAESPAVAVEVSFAPLSDELTVKEEEPVIATKNEDFSADAPADEEKDTKDASELATEEENSVSEPYIPVVAEEPQAVQDDKSIEEASVTSDNDNETRAVDVALVEKTSTKEKLLESAPAVEEDKSQDAADIQVEAFEPKEEAAGSSDSQPATAESIESIEVALPASTVESTPANDVSAETNNVGESKAVEVTPTVAKEEVVEVSATDPEPIKDEPTEPTVQEEIAVESDGLHSEKADTVDEEIALEVASEPIAGQEESASFAGPDPVPADIAVVEADPASIEVATVVKTENTPTETENDALEASKVVLEVEAKEAVEPSEVAQVPVSEEISEDKAQDEESNVVDIDQDAPQEFVSEPVEVVFEEEAIEAAAISLPEEIAAASHEPTSLDAVTEAPASPAEEVAVSDNAEDVTEEQLADATSAVEPVLEQTVEIAPVEVPSETEAVSDVISEEHESSVDIQAIDKVNPEGAPALEEPEAVSEPALPEETAAVVEIAQQSAEEEAPIVSEAVAEAEPQIEVGELITQTEVATGDAAEPAVVDVQAKEDGRAVEEETPAVVEAEEPVVEIQEVEDVPRTSHVADSTESSTETFVNSASPEIVVVKELKEESAVLHEDVEQEKDTQDVTLQINGEPISVEAAGTIERPKSPYPSAFEVTTVGRGAGAVEAPDEAAEASEEVTVAAPVPAVIATEVEADDSPKAAEASDALSTSGPWTPSYSVHSQGSPLQLPEDSNDEVTEVQTGRSIPIAATEEIPSIQEQVADVAEAVIAEEVPETVAHEVPAVAISDSGEVSELDAASPLDTAVKVEIEEAAAVVPEVIEHQDEPKADVVTAIVVEDAAEAKEQTHPSVEPEQKGEELVKVDILVNGAEEITETAQSESLATSNSTEDAVASTEQSRSSSPWVPSYSVSRQGSPLIQAKVIENESTPVEELSISEPADVVAVSGPVPVPAIVEEQKPVELLEVVDRAPTSADFEDESKDISAQSYSVFTQGPEVKGDAPVEASSPVVTEKAVVFEHPEVSRISDEKDRIASGEQTPTQDTFKAVPAAVSDVEIAEKSLNANEEAATRQPVEGSVRASIAALPLVSSITGRKRMESSASTSRFFPGWASAHKKPDESRPSLETAAGEFTVEVNGNGSALPPISTAELQVPPADPAEFSASSTASSHRRKWCLIM